MDEGGKKDTVIVALAVIHAEDREDEGETVFDAGEDSGAGSSVGWNRKFADGWERTFGKKDPS